MPSDFSVEPLGEAPGDPRIRRLRWSALVLLALGIGACLATGADQPADPALLESRQFAGFGEIAIRIHPPDPLASTQHCAVLAATDRQRTRGLMGVTDLRGYVGMLFRFPVDSQAAFHMKSTPMPLSVAFFAADGSFVSATDMEPCDDRADCPIYGASGPYRYALEVPQGDLVRIGVGPGSRIELVGPCAST